MNMFMLILHAYQCILYFNPIKIYLATETEKEQYVPWLRNHEILMSTLNDKYTGG